MTRRAADGLGDFLGQLKDRLSEAEVAGFDETGLRVSGTVHWVHCARTDRYTLITCHAKRGRKGIDDAGVLSRFRGVAVHDAWAPYDTYVDTQHQLCCAHALRELAAVADTAPPDAHWCWASQAADALVAMQRLVAQAIAAGADTVDADTLHPRIQLYRSAAQIGITQTAARSDAVMKKHNALARRLIDRQDDYLRFTQDWRIPRRQQRLRTGHPHAQAEAEGVRLPAHPHRSHTVLRDTQLPIHCRQTRPALLRNPRHARRGSTMAAHKSLT